MNLTFYTGFSDCQARGFSLARPSTTTQLCHLQQLQRHYSSTSRLFLWTCKQWYGMAFKEYFGSFHHRHQRGRKRPYYCVGNSCISSTLLWYRIHCCVLFLIYLWNVIRENSMGKRLFLILYYSQEFIYTCLCVSAVFQLGLYCILSMAMNRLYARFQRF